MATGRTRSGPSAGPINLATTVSRLADALVASAGMRDYLDAIRSRVVVFDGGMGATLEQFDLSLERDYQLPGRAHEALVLNRPDVIEGVHASMVEAGAEVVETDTFQASRLKLDEWGLGDHTLEINRSAAQIARKAVGEHRFVAGSIGPTGHLPASDDPTLGAITFRELVDGLRGAGARPASRAAPTCSSSRPRRTSSRSRPRSSAPARRSRRSAAPCRSRPRVSLLPNGGKMLLGTDISAVAGDARGAEGRRHRPELLDRPRGHARRDPLPRRVLARAGPLHPERRPAAAGPRRRDDLPRAARAAGRRARRVRRALRRRDRRRLLRHDARAHRARSPSAAPTAATASRPAPRRASRRSAR